MEHYDGESPGLGTEFVQAVADCIERVNAYPESYPVIIQVYRRARIHRFPYGIVYRIRANELEIVSVMHDRRKPDLYLDRIT